MGVDRARARFDLWTNFRPRGRRRISRSRAALKGEPATGTVNLQPGAFYVVAVPVILPEKWRSQQAGVLTIGVRIGESALQELKKVTHTDIFLLANGQMITSTLPGREALLLPQIDVPARR